MIDNYVTGAQIKTQILQKASFTFALSAVM